MGGIRGSTAHCGRERYSSRQDFSIIRCRESAARPLLQCTEGFLPFAVARMRPGKLARERSHALQLRQRRRMFIGIHELDLTVLADAETRSCAFDAPAADAFSGGYARGHCLV